MIINILTTGGSLDKSQMYHYQTLIPYIIFNETSSGHLEIENIQIMNNNNNNPSISNAQFQILQTIIMEVIYFLHHLMVI